MNTEIKKNDIRKELIATKNRLWQFKLLSLTLAILLIASIAFNIANSFHINDLKNEISEISASYEEAISSNAAAIEEDVLEETIPDELNEETIPPTIETVPEETIVPDAFSSVPLDGELKEYIYTSAINANIPAEILFAMAWKESAFNHTARSSTNDHGLFQINTCNFSRMATKFGYDYNDFAENKIYDPYVNTDCAIAILVEYRDNYNNSNWHHVLMRYNLGPGGAQQQFNDGNYSTSYSREIINYAETNFDFSNIDLV